MIKEGNFLEDLYYRLNIVPIYLPPLKERQEDISMLAMHFLKEYADETGKRVKTFTPEAIEKLMIYTWPGNVRELENVIERTVVMIDDEMVRPEHIILPGQKEKESLGDYVPITSEELKEVKKKLREKVVEDIERTFVLNALERHNWNVTRAAEEVGMLRTNFQALMKKYNLRARGD